MDLFTLRISKNRRVFGLHSSVLFWWILLFISLTKILDAILKKVFANFSINLRKACKCVQVISHSWLVFSFHCTHGLASAMLYIILSIWTVWQKTISDFLMQQECVFLATHLRDNVTAWHISNTIRFCKM